MIDIVLRQYNPKGYLQRNKKGYNPRATARCDYILFTL